MNKYLKISLISSFCIPLVASSSPKVAPKEEANALEFYRCVASLRVIIPDEILTYQQIQESCKSSPKADAKPEDLGKL